MENKWSNKYLLDIEKVDQQHQVFFELWDESTKQIDLHDNTQLASILVKLEDYLKNHFNEEEELMRKSNYEDLDNHLTQHKFFIQKIDNLKQEFNYSNPLLFEKTTVFMKKWFLNHIIQSDQKYKESVTAYLKSNK